MSVVYANYPIGSEESIELGIMENGTIKDGQGYHIRINKPYEFLDNLRCIILEEEILIKAPNIYSNTKKHIKSLIKKAFDMTFPKVDNDNSIRFMNTESSHNETPSAIVAPLMSSETASMSRETPSAIVEAPLMSREASLTSSDTPSIASEASLIYNLTPSQPLNHSVMDNINNVISNCINSFPQSHWDSLPVNISRTKIYSMKRNDLLLAIRETAEYHNITIPLNAINNLTLPHIKNTLRMMLRYK